MRTEPKVKVLLSLPLSQKKYLDDLKRLEGVTASGYIRKYLELDREARMGQGWSPKDGWPEGAPVYGGRRPTSRTSSRKPR